VTGPLVLVDNDWGGDGPTHRCVALGCGDKIKDPKMWREVEPDGTVWHFHDGCVEDGKPVDWTQR
jgi:hypothetical protein